MAAKPRQDDALVLALAAGASIVDAARQAGCSERTAHRRLANSDFRQRVIQARHEMSDQAIGMLSHGTTTAAATLVALLACKSPTIRLAAARAVLDSRTKLWESTELEQRLAAIEERLAKAKQQRNGGNRDL